MPYRDDSLAPTPPRILLGGVAAIGFGALLTWQAFMPTTYLYQAPGPALSVTELEGSPVIVLTNTDAPTYPSETDLHLTTVSTFGNPEESVLGAAALEAYLDNDKNLIPVRALYSEEITTEEVRASSAAMMANSQIDAVLAGYGLAGIEIPVTLTMVYVAEGSNAEGLIEENDVLVSLQAPGEDAYLPSTFPQLREYLAGIEPGTELEVTVERGGAERVVSFETIAPTDGSEGSLLGVGVVTEPQEGSPGANISLENIGGPSAGQMFALEIYDQLTEGSLGGDNVIAGTGTVDSLGDIGPIGGIEHKLIGARNAGATYFLAPVENCDEVIGNEVDGMQIIAVDTLDDSVEALDAIKAGDTGHLPTCEG
ncbi:pdz/dhr/glgf protein [Flaviflexus ciconiae]|uniref:endopeptidase La n=1 Tax=Flaviflexus ciconiae TaxID=2496867 RepID=A0A3Q9G6Y2_9ACTO|nr:S16 family serine protease [Flaviflexus ciconiae]AZQ77076.1 pdz/dhr/glgf protein [Flaviflexus ciconiae]